VIAISEDLKDQILGNLVHAVELLLECKILADFMPEVRMNLAFCLPNPKSVDDVAAIPGRITAYEGQLLTNKYPAFGASDHLARALMEVQKLDSTIRAVINFKYTPDLYKWLESYSKRENLILVRVDRTAEPSDVRTIDGASMPWKIGKAIELARNRVPDLTCETEAPGKEPLFKLFGKTATEVATKLIKIANAWAKRK
jgi:predicted fused transcriptional regulator/phosphomethylpyrimidine kinase